MAKPLLSSAPGEMALLIEEGLGLGLPLGGVMSDTQASIWFAVHHQRPTGPHQMCQYPDVKEVAQPSCEADRHGKQELKKQIRGISALERQAEHSPSNAAQVVADDGLASPTVMRDDGT